jgi:hypothetical protein
MESIVMRKLGWENSTNGPDWIDVEGLMRAIQALHSGAVALTVSPTGTGFGTGVCMTARMNFDVLPGSALPPVVEVTKGWPCDQHKTLVSHAFSLMYELDAAIGKVYKQESLWE